MKSINDIEVKEAKVCNGSCESCRCQLDQVNFPPEKQKEVGIEVITFEASFHANQDTYHAKEDKNFGALVQEIAGGWGKLVWFPKSICSYTRPPLVKGNFVHVTAPKWLLEDRKIMGLIKIVE